MDAQSDIGKLAEASTTSRALAVASHEIALVANFPAFNDGERPFEAMERLTTSTDTLKADMNDRLESLGLYLRAESAYSSLFLNFIVIIFCSPLNYMAKVYNSHISSRDTPLRILHDQHNMTVERIPKRFSQLNKASRSGKVSH